MGLDISITRSAEVKCPHCGTVVNVVQEQTVKSGGSEWCAFLISVGYYHTAGQLVGGARDWRGEDMVLSDGQMRRMIEFADRKSPVNYKDVEALVALAMVKGQKVVINADW